MSGALGSPTVRVRAIDFDELALRHPIAGARTSTVRTVRDRAHTEFTVELPASGEDVQQRPGTDRPGGCRTTESAPTLTP